MKEKGAQQVFLRGGEDMDREECTTAPLRSPYKLSASDQSLLLPPSSLTPLSSDIELHSPVCGLLHAVSWLTLTNSTPIYIRKDKRGKEGGSTTKGRLKVQERKVD